MLPLKDIIITEKFKSLGKNWKDHEENNNKIQNFIREENPDVVLYTDASSKGGISCVDQDDNVLLKRKYEGFGIDTLECAALCYAFIKGPVRHPDKYYIIFTDRESALRSLGSKKPHKNKYLITILNNIRTSNENLNFKLVFIPSHAGIKGNELADKVAKDANKLEPVRKLSPLAISLHSKLTGQ